MDRANIETIQQASDWLLGAEPGDQVLYHIGLLPRDRIFERRLDGLASWMMDMASTDKSLILLTQARLDNRVYAYVATRSSLQ